ncbi:MAG TPA: vWA domain-containing protein [Kofleriaceae bacterium]|nr:vWA domain-containing protein [Kofleriaceae bacterium]
MRALALAILLVPGAASADDVLAAPRSLAVRLDGTAAVIDVRVAVSGPPSFNSEAAEFVVPPHAVITATTATVGGVRHKLALTPADSAADQFQKLAAIEAGNHPRSALKIYASGDLIELGSALPSAADLALDVELSAPTCFLRDTRYVTLPHQWAAAITRAGLRAQPVATPGLDPCRRIGDDDMLFVGLPSGELAAEPPGDRRVGAIAGELPLVDRKVARVELDIAATMSAVPADLRTAIVIDASRSLTPAEAETQRAIVLAYLRAAPMTSVQLIGYSRTASPLLPGWMNAAAALPRVDRALRALVRGNGSNVDVALSAAATWLERAPGTHRVLLFSDDRLADRFDEAAVVALRRRAPEGTLVHVVALDGDGGGLVRDDGERLAALATATEGIAVRAGGDKGVVDATMLVRPLSIDSVHVTAPGWEALSLGDEPCGLAQTDLSLAEGSACSWWGRADGVGGPIAIEGLVWGRRFVRVVQPDRGQGRALARLLAMTHPFEDAVNLEIDRLAYAVDAAWSLFGAWGGNDGYTPEVIATCGGGGSFLTSSHDVGATITDGFLKPPPPLPVRDQLARAVLACNLGLARVEIGLETTRDEIVDVAVDVIATPSMSSHDAHVLEDCATEAAWSTPLALPGPPEHAKFEVAFGTGAPTDQRVQ